MEAIVVTDNKFAQQFRTRFHRNSSPSEPPSADAEKPLEPSPISSLNNQTNPSSNTPSASAEHMQEPPNPEPRGFAGNHNGVVPLLPSLSASVVRPLCSPLQQQLSLAHHPRHHRRRRSQGCQAQSRREYGAPRGCTIIKSSWFFSFLLSLKAYVSTRLSFYNN